MTVHQFPPKDKEREALVNTTEALDEIYMALNKMYESINELELRAAEIEASYDVDLEKYVRRVGIGNTPVHLLNYSMKALDYYYEWKEENQ